MLEFRRELDWSQGEAPTGECVPLSDRLSGLEIRVGKKSVERPDAQIGHRLERTLYSHSELYSIAQVALADGREHQYRGYHVAAIVMTAFSLEAYLNFLGEKVFPIWSEIEYIPVENKMRALCTHLGITLDFGCRPHQSIRLLWRIRNALAHARSESMSVEREGLPPDDPEYPEAEWERDCNMETAVRLAEDVREVCDALHKKAGLTVGALGHRGLQGGTILRS